MPKKITAYETKDGQVFANLEKAVQYEKELNLKANVINFVNKHRWSGMGKDDVIDIILENIDELREILK